MPAVSSLRQGQDDPPPDFGSLFRAAPGVYLVLLPDAPKYTIISASSDYEIATLIKGEDVKGTSIFDIPYHAKHKNPSVIESLRDSLERVIRDLKDHEMEAQQYDVPRSPEMGGGFEVQQWIQRNRPVFDSDGKIQYIIYRIEDVTKKIQEEKERNRFFDVAADLLVKSSFDGYFKQVNPAWEKTLGWTENELTATPWIDFVHPDDQERTLAASNHVNSGSELAVFENRYRCRDGSYRWLNWKAQPFADEGMIYCAATDVTEQKKSEEALLESERQFRQLSDSIPQLAWMADKEGWIFWYNQRWYDFTGKSPKEMEGWGWESVHDPIILPFVKEEWMKSLQSGKPFDMIFPLKGKDGLFRTFLTRVNPFRDSSGDITRWFGTNTDITEQRESEERFRQLADAMPQVVWTARPDGYLDYVNNRCFEYSGVLKMADGTVDWTAIVHPEDLPGTVEAWTRCVQSGKPYEVQQRVLHEKSGEYRWNLTRALPAKNAKGEVTRWYGTNTDIEDQKRIYDTLHETQQFNQSIIDSSPDCIKVIDLEGRLISMNEEGCRQMEVDDFAVCVNANWISFWDGLERQEAERVLIEARAGKTARFEGFCATQKGTPKWWEVIVTPINGKEGIPIQLLCVSREITARKKLETAALEARQQAESANLAKSEFLANMSHEIRTPMNAVIGLATILSKTEGLTTKQKEYIHTLQLSADSLLSLINDLLDISKIEARSIELEHVPFSITQLLNEVISMMSVRAREKGLEFNAKGDFEKHHMLIGDPMRLRQIVLNLCSNAIKFTEKGGVYISIVHEPSKLKGIEDVSISVTDTGIGIPLDKQETIFQKFIQADSSINRKYGGTGLGLAITKTLTEIMDGTVTIKSTPGKGSTFTVKLPLMVGDNDTAAPPAHEISARAPDKIHEYKHRVLLVEDYAANVLVAGSYLELFGYAYDVVDNGYDAVEKAKNGNYLAILMDVQMHGINGFETTKLIRQHEKKEGKPRVTIIGMTAHALTGDRERCLAVDMDDYLSKPYNPDVLEEMLAKCIQSETTPA